MPEDHEGDFDAFYAAHYARVVGRLTVVAGSRAAAEDAVQEAFVRLIQRWTRVCRYDDPAAWVRRVAHNLLLDRHRANGRARQLIAKLVDRRPAHHEDAYPSLDAFDEAVGALSPLHRQVLVLHLVDDLSVDEVAAELGIPAGTVKSRLSRARSALEQQLIESRSHE